jgi:two-component system NtrC family response regulator
VAATNRNPDNMVQTGRFRNDLLFRLRTLTINLPPLRERREDIKDLALYHVTKFCDRHQMGTKGFSPEFFDALTAYNWPGNVRELLNTLETVLTVARHDHTLFAKHLPVLIRIQVARSAVSKKIPTDCSPEEGTDSAKTLPPLRDIRKAAAAEAEKRYLQDLISITRNNIKEACRITGLSRSRLYELLKNHKMSFPQ